MKKIWSFDVFDTILVRSVGVPRDLFVAVGEAWRQRGLSELESLAAAELRIESEKIAGRNAEGGQASIAEIYDVLAARMKWSSEKREEAARLEMEIEGADLDLVPGIEKRIASARNEGWKIVFISDTYFPATFLQGELARRGIFKGDDLLFVSNQERAGKGTGKLFDIIKKALGDPNEWRHSGDDAGADIQMPQSRGIQTFPLPQGRLTRYEAALRGGLEPMVVPWWQSRVAGACRRARLDLDRRISERNEIIPTATGIAAPLLSAFVLWTLQQAEEKGLKRLYFLSRDGQILLKIARALQAKVGNKIDCRYLIASRQAWRTAALDQVGEEEIQLVESAGNISWRRLLDLTALDPESCVADLERIGITAAEWDSAVDPTKAQRWIETLRSGAVGDSVKAGAARKRAMLLDYFRQETFFEFPDCGIVDIGWYGRLQTSLDKVLSHLPTEQRPTVHGFYFGLKESLSDLETHRKFRRFGFWNEFISRDVTPLEMAFLERFTAADHGSALGFERNADKSVRPVLANAENGPALEWGLRTLQTCIEETARRIGTLDEFDVVDPGSMLKSAVMGLEKLLANPTIEEAKLWGSFAMSSQQIETTFDLLIPNWTWAKTMAAIRSWRERPNVWWKEGSRVTGTILPIWLYLRGLETPIQKARLLSQRFRAWRAKL